MLGKTKLRHMDVGHLKLVALLQSHLAAGIATTRPRNSILVKFLLARMMVEKLDSLVKGVETAFQYRDIEEFLCSILIAISQVLIEIHNGEHVWHVLVCILGN